MKLPILLFACIFLKIGSPIFSQNTNLDSLQNLLATATDPARQLEILEKLATETNVSDSKKAQVFAQQGIEISEKTGSRKHLPQFFQTLGQCFMEQSKYDSASIFFNRALDGFAAAGDARGQATTLAKLAHTARRTGDFVKAFDLDLRGLRLAEPLGDPEIITDANIGLSQDCYYQQNRSGAEQYAQKAVEIAEKNDLKRPLFTAYKNMAFVFWMPPYDFEKALFYSTKALALCKKLNLSQRNLLATMNDRGNALKKLGRYDEAVAAYQEFLTLSEASNVPIAIAVGNANLGETHLLHGHFAEALPFTQKAIRMMEERHDNMNLMENYGHLSAIHEKLGNWQLALETQKKAAALRDSLLSVEKDKTMSELRTQYETEKKEAQITAQQAEISQKNKIQWLILGLAGLLGFVLFQTWRTAKFRKTTNEKLAEANANLEKKNAENVLLLKEIHHRVKNNLQTISSLLSLQSANLKDEESRAAVEAGQHRVQSMALIHQKLYQRDNLAGIEMRDYLTNLGQSLFESFDVDERRISLKIDVSETELDVDTAVPIGLIVNELVTNSLKYAFPGRRMGEVKISFQSFGENGFELRVSDDGVGVSTEKPGTNFGSRLVNLLAVQLGGKLEQGVEYGFWTRLRVG